MKELFPVVNGKAADSGMPRPVQKITCGCGQASTISAHNGRGSDEHVAGTFIKRGWLVGHNGRHTCPACQLARRAARKALKDDQRKGPGMITVQASTSPGASAKIVELYMELEDCYDRAAKTYKPGWTDDLVAAKVGVSPDLVKARREQDFGPVVVDTLAADLRAQLAELRQKCAALERTVEAVSTIAVVLTRHSVDIAANTERALARLEKANA